MAVALYLRNMWKGYVKKGNQKLHALALCAQHMSTDKRRTLSKAFVVSQFNYCFLVWTFHTKELNNWINSLHET